MRNWCSSEEISKEESHSSPRQSLTASLSRWEKVRHSAGCWKTSHTFLPTPAPALFELWTSSRLCHWASFFHSCLREVVIEQSWSENSKVEHLNYQRDKLGHDLLILSRNPGERLRNDLVDLEKLNCMQNPDLKFADSQFFNWLIPRDTKVHVSYLLSMVINCTA